MALPVACPDSLFGGVGLSTILDERYRLTSSSDFVMPRSKTMLAIA